MSWSENTVQENISVSQDISVPENNLFTGDTGVLALDTRRALVLLLSGPSLDGQRHTKL